MTLHGSEGAGGLDQAVLLEQVSWIRRLARQLVADRELAEDLVQETCVVALQHAPREGCKLRQWLAQVLRNALRQHARSQGRRSGREAAAVAGEAHESPERLVERVLLQRELVGAVLELDEPYRSTVLLRYFEELPPGEIARRTGTPLATVQSRLQRALARLRERLDGRNQAWAALFLPWVRGFESFGPSTLLSLLMKTKLTLAVAATMMAAGALVWWKTTPDSARGGAEASAPALVAADPLVSARTRPPEPEAPEAEREALPVTPGIVPAPAQPVPAPAPAAAWSVRLRVLDADGGPMAGIAVRAEDEERVLATSGAGGWCVFETRAERLVLRAADPSWVTIHEGSPSRASSVDPVLVLAPALDLGGHVRDESGRPLAGAGVRFELPEGFRTRFDELLEASRVLGWQSGSDRDGVFALERVPAVPGATLSAVLAGYAHVSLEVPLVSAHDLELVLRRPVLPLAGVLRGEVRESGGARVSGARVGLGLTSVVSDEQGRFEVPLARAVTAEVITAVKAGFLPARLERPGEPGPDTSGWPAHVVLVLPGPALAIRGVVLDHEGKPVPAARVWVHDPTPSAPIGMVPGFLEPLMAGASVPPAALESEANLPAEDGDNFYDWHTNVHAPSALWHWVETDATGHFELGGLDQRRYRLDVLRPGGLEVITSDSLAAGEATAVIRLAPPDVHARVRGRVLAEDGSGIFGVEVSLYRPMIDARARIFGGRSQVVVIEPAGTRTTDAEGAFEFSDVPRTGAVFSVRGDDIVPTSADVTGESVDIPVEVRCHLEVVLREPFGRFDGIQVKDGEGQGLDILVLTEGSTNAWTSVPLVRGRSGVVSVSSRARTLELLQGEAVVETRALDLLPGDVNRIEL